jgi:PAS domain S-box-containing protein
MRKRAEEALREREERFRGMFEKHSAVMLLIEPVTGKILNANKAAERFYGYTVSQLLSMSIQDINALPPDEVEAQRSLALEYQRNYFIFPHRLANGDVRTVEIHSSPIEQNGTLLLFSIIHDITERKRIEEVLKQRTEDLERSNNDLEQFAYVAAHDLREPLVAVAAYLKVLERLSRDALEDKGRVCIAKAINLVLRMDSMLQGLLAYSRLTLTPLSYEVTDCNTCLAGALSNLGLSIKKSGAVVTSDTLPTLKINDSQLVLVFQNLIGNAIKYRDSEPLRVHVGCISKESYYQFSVSDNGVGIEPPYLDRIFKMFERVKDLSGPTGTGIGLSTCRKIVERYGGRIWVESHVEKGSTFYFTLPTG